MGVYRKRFHNRRRFPYSILTVPASVTLTIDDALNTIAIESPTLTQKSTLAVQDVLNSLTSDNVDLVVSTILTIADVLNAIVADSPTLTQKSILTIAEILNAVAMDSPALTPILAIADALASIAMDSPALTPILAVSDILEGITADNVDLVSDVLLSIQEMIIQPLVDLVNLGEFPGLCFMGFVISQPAMAVSTIAPAITMTIKQPLITIAEGNIISSEILAIAETSVSVLSESPTLTIPR